MAKEARLLYVDDEDALRELVQNQLEAEGFLVETADDGDTGIAMLGKHTFDVILLDMRMPRVNGIEVLKHIREKKIPSRVIVVTAVDDLSVAIEAVKNGASDYITKPYELGALLASIQRVLSK